MKTPCILLEFQSCYQAKCYPPELWFFFILSSFIHLPFFIITVGILHFLLLTEPFKGKHWLKWIIKSPLSAYLPVIHAINMFLLIIFLRYAHPFFCSCFEEQWSVAWCEGARVFGLSVCREPAVDGKFWNAFLLLFIMSLRCFTTQLDSPPLRRQILCIKQAFYCCLWYVEKVPWLWYWVCSE